MTVPVEEKVVISLQRYEDMKEKAERKSVSSEKYRAMKSTFKRSSAELGQFLNHLAKKVENIQDLVNAFNANSSESEIIYNEDKDRYYINLIEDEEEEDNE